MKNRLKYFSFVFTLVFFLAVGCGLETTYNVSSPIITGNPPVYTNVDKTLNFFAFTTNEDDAANLSVQMQGTAVLYKIYHNTSTLDSVTTAIDTLNTSSTSTSDAAYRSLISRGYQELGKDGGATSPLIPYVGGDQSVEIRLTKFQENNPQWDSRITVDGIRVGTPRRFGDRHSFDWGRRDSQDDRDLNALPVSTDSDYNSTGSFSQSGFYYVDAYSVNIGWDESFAQQFGRVLHLGTIVVDSNSREN